MKKVEKSDAQWRDSLTEQQYRVLRQAGTERAFTGKYVDTDDDGQYRCAGCGNPLFTSQTKYHSGCGWPSFWDVLDQANVELRQDNSLGMRRIEVVCARCDGHLGHVFEDGPRDRTGLRYCINSAALAFEPDQE
jgi:peptide-methionine (R)-S-oxide reductase